MHAYPAIVLLPGMDGTGKLFADFIAALGGAVRTVVVVYPTDRQLDYREMTAFARRQLPADAPFILLGESFSGPIAIALAAERPPGLAGLVLCCTFARNPIPLASKLRGLLSVAPLPGGALRMLAPVLLGTTNSPALNEVLSTVPASLLRQRLVEVLKVDYSALASGLSLPVLYLQAEDDRLVPASACKHLRALIPSMHVTRLPTPHLLLQCAPVAAAKAVLDFIETTKPGPA